MMTSEKQNHANDDTVDKNPKTQKKPKRDKTDLGPDFVAPDGGWAWVVCVASGFSTLCVFAASQQYGIIYRERMKALDFSAMQITTILNVEMAMGALFGVISGAVFRRFTFRRVGIVGGVLVFVGVLLTAFCQTFVQYFISFSLIYGIGFGMNIMATSLAVNTYFKKNRRRAMGIAQTIIGIGPMILPHICTYLLGVYGTQGTVLIVAAIALNTVACSCTLQPVMWHVKKAHQVDSVVKTAEQKSSSTTEEQMTSTDDQCEFCRYKKNNERGSLPTQYTFNKDDTEQPGYELKELGEQMLSYDNDGFIASELSLAPESISSGTNGNLDKLQKPEDSNRERDNSLRHESKMNSKNPERCTCVDERELVLQTLDKQLQHHEMNAKQVDEAARCEMSFRQKVVKFFDLDLLRDVTFLNLAQGISFAMFLETNFAFLIPFILDSYGYTNSEIATAMSFVSAVDLVIRLTAPFALEKCKFSNQACCAFGIIILIIGRYLLVMVDSFYPMLAVFLFIGVGRGFRSLFLQLIIPSYVPLDRLAAAIGLLLFFKSIFTLTVGPVNGIIADLTSYTFMVHFINLVMIISMSLWGLEWFVRRRLEKSRKIQMEE